MFELLDIFKENILFINLLIMTSYLGFEIISKVPAVLHTPLMSVTNAISSVIIVGAIIASFSSSETNAISFSNILGFLAVTLAAINIFGGFLVTQRMLQMYKKKEKKKNNVS